MRETPEIGGCNPDCPSWGVEDPCVHPTHTRPETPETAPCKCSHSSDAHDAGECWAMVDSAQCPCAWYEPVARGDLP